MSLPLRSRVSVLSISKPTMESVSVMNRPIAKPIDGRNAPDTRVPKYAVASAWAGPADANRHAAHSTVGSFMGDRLLDEIPATGARVAGARRRSPEGMLKSAERCGGLENASRRSGTAGLVPPTRGAGRA